MPPVFYLEILMPRTGNLISLIFLLILISGCSRGESIELPLPPAGLIGDPEKIALGKQLFLAHCAECHGSLSEGRTQRAARFKPGAPDFQERRYQTALPGYLYKRIEQGRNMEPFRSAGSVMPPWSAHLKKEQIWGLVAFIRDRAGPTSKE